MSRGSTEKRQTKEITISNAVSSLFFFPSALFLSSMVRLYYLNYVNDYSTCYEHCRIYTSVNCVQYGGFTHKTTRVKCYTQFPKICVYFLVYFCMYFFTRVFRECISRVICVNAVMPVACAVAVKSLSETFTKNRGTESLLMCLEQRHITIH